MHRPLSRSRQDRSLLPLITVTAASLVFAVLLALVLVRYRPLETADHDAATSLNSLVSGHPVLIAVIKAVTSLGSTPVLVGVVVAAGIYLAIRRRWRLLLFLAVSVAGSFWSTRY